MEFYNRKASISYPHREQTGTIEGYDIATFIKKTYQLFAASILAAATGAYIGMQMAPALQPGIGDS